MKNQKIDAFTRILVVVSTAMLLIVPALAESVTGKLLTYEEIVEAVRDLNADAGKISKKLVGKTVRLHLMPSHPAELKNLVVDVNDSIYFYCNKRPAGFREGVVTAKIIKVESTPDDGDPWFTLDRCVK